MKDVVWFSQVDKGDVGLVGGKGANLGELVKAKIPVPNGFIVTAQAYYSEIEKAGSLDRIRGILYGIDVENPSLLQTKAIECQKEIKKIKISNELEENIFKYYEKLSSGSNKYVAVRSSATAEDLPDASFAGQQETFLNIKGKKELINAITSAWASLFGARAIYYRAQKNFDHFKVGIAIPVQLMIQSQTSGVMFTIDPITNDKKIITIEAVFGLGELIVSGQVTPDHYEVSKENFTIVKKDIVKQEKQLIGAKKGNKMVTVSKPHQKSQKLPDDKIIELAKIGKNIESHYYFPQDIEWAYQDKELYIVQSRPITTIKAEHKEVLQKKDDIFSNKKPILQGAPASPVIGTGKVVIIHSPAEIEKVKKGDVLVTEMTNPDFVPAMKRASAIVTDRGGRTSHAAIVSRELGISCIVGTQNATKILKNNQVITVNGSTGAVYEGQLQTTSSKKSSHKKSKKGIHHKTATNLYVNLAEPDLAPEVAAKNVDGVGLLRAEFMLAEIGTHPKKYLEDGNGEEFIKELVKGLSVFGKSFGKRPVIYRATDLKSNEYRSLKGGDKYEPKESNPMLGYRGAFRYIKDPDVFKLELEAIKRVRERYRNLHLMIPFVRNVKELQTVKNIVEEADLFKDKDFKFLMMCEIPSNVILLEKFIDVGIDGISIGSNDLTMLVLGTDRDNEEVAGEFNELDESVLWALEKLVKTAAKRGITSSICGQAPSDYPQLTEKLVSWGISSISVNPDVIESTRQVIYESEKKIDQH